MHDSVRVCSECDTSRVRRVDAPAAPFAGAMTRSGLAKEAVPSWHRSLDLSNSGEAFFKPSLNSYKTMMLGNPLTRVQDSESSPHKRITNFASAMSCRIQSRLQYGLR